MSCGAGCRCSSDPTLLWLWSRPAAVAPIWPLAWELPYAESAAPGKKKDLKPEKYLDYRTVTIPTNPDVFLRRMTSCKSPLVIILPILPPKVSSGSSEQHDEAGPPLSGEEVTPRREAAKEQSPYTPGIKDKYLVSTHPVIRVNSSSFSEWIDTAC